ncbi:HD-GYP domain-containing protein [Marinomonas sp. PE14-40]|uniref:HD-GYP domain-containing protein n=1 Tax=Marinomonas sp. PE14-40 TaxID=3060621 RepID=UPI003F662EA7
MGQVVCKNFSSLDHELKKDLVECYKEAQLEIEEIINDIEDQGFAFEKLDTLFRSLHSMKGNCSVCFLDPLVEVLHKLEEIVDGMRGHYIAYTVSLGELTNTIIEEVGAILRELFSSHVVEDDQLVLMRDQLTELYDLEDDALRGTKAEKVLTLLAEEGAQDADDETDVLLVKAEFSTEQIADIEQFKALSAKLNKLLGYSPERGERIVKLCLLINNDLSNPVDAAQLSAAAYMHGMGRALVLKAQDDEQAKIAAEINHPIVGAQLLSKHPGWEEAVVIVKSHEERFDGTGFPEALVGSLIPPGAFVLSMAVKFIDLVWGASGNEYKSSAMKAVQKINFESGKQFPPHFIDVFNQTIRKVLVAKNR